MKRCISCQSDKSESEFYSDRRRRDGLKSQCKRCHSETSIRTRDADLHRASNASHMRRARDADPERFRERERNAIRRYPERVAARTKLNTALRLGHITKPEKCSACDCSSRLTAHHHDYSKPLDVEWLCYPCHGKEHRHV